MHKVLRVARNRGEARIWIERGTLLRAGIHAGDRFTFEVVGERIVLDILGPDTGYPGRLRTVSGSADRPVIDICNRTVSAFMGDATHYRATFEPGQVVITREVVP